MTTKLYHGSNNKFNEFDFSYIGKNGTSEGKGFYFTDNLKVADSYAENGYIYEVELNLGLGINDKELKIKKSQYKKLIIALDKELEILSNYGDVDYQGYNKVLNECLNCELEYSESDVDVLSSLATSCGSIETVNRIAYKVLGVTHIEVENAEWGNQSIVIALVPEIIKIIEIKNK